MKTIDIQGQIRSRVRKWRVWNENSGMMMCREGGWKLYPGWILMDWTGLQDSAQKDVYEGDIVEFDVGVGGRFTGVVKWEDGAFGVVFENDGDEEWVEIAAQLKLLAMTGRSGE